ncbi:hypothetical protein Bbelb_413170 [Branchiostoma belcheri]|nr:hypothetical protein Bbelb_413170 [Branchiostoma belcheri]
MHVHVKDVGATGIGTDGEPVTHVGTLAYRPARLAAVGRRDHRLGPATGSATTAEHPSRTLVVCQPEVDCDLECIHGLTTNEHGCEVCRCKTSEQDVNECTVNRGGCEHDCVDTEEGYNCTCRDGYTDTDVDECATSNGGCQQTCINTEGTFYCSCQEGYSLDFDGTTCQDVNECQSLEWRDCHHCTNTPGSSNCTCKDRHRLVDGKECRDDDLYPYGIEICDNGIVSFDRIQRPQWPVKLTSYQWRYQAVIAPFLARSRPHAGSKIFYELYSKYDQNPHTLGVLLRAREDGRSVRGFYLPDYDPVWALVVTWTDIVPDNSVCPRGDCPAGTTLPRNTFQLVLSTDGTHSFAHFIYPSKKIEWASPDEILGQTSHPNAIAVAGYNAGQGWWFNYARDMEYSGTMKMKWAWLKYGGHWSYPLQEQSDLYVPQPSVLRCAAWIRRQEDDVGLEWFLKHMYHRLESTYSCPCTAEQAFYDNTYRYSVTGTGSCAESRRRLTFHYGGKRYSFRRTCCYSPAFFWWERRVGWRGWWWRRARVILRRRRVGGGRLLGGSIGGHLLLNDRLEDEEARHQCCVESGRVRNGWYCQRFSQLRPWSVPQSWGTGSPCRNYPIRIAWIRRVRRRTRFWGDPHISTLDGVRYTFNGLGEFVLVDMEDGEYQVQGRTCFAKGSSRATIFCAIAAAQRNHTGIQVNLEGDSGAELYVNSTAVNISPFEDEDLELEVDGSALVTRPSNNSILIVFFSGITLKVTANKAMLFVEFSALMEYMNKTRGLLGRWDGDTSNDFEFSNGTVLHPNSSERQVFEMGNSWLVTDDDGPMKSIFHYKPGESSSNFTSAGFIPKFTDEVTFSDPDLEEHARDVCGNDTSCLFDVAETGDIEVGRVETEDEQNFDDEMSIQNTFPPVLTGPEAVYAKLGDVVEIRINATDPAGLDMTFDIGDEMPPEISVLINGTDVTLLWNVTCDDFFNLQLISTNTKNSSAEYWPVVYMCSCRNNGSCHTTSAIDPALVSDDERFVRLDCACQDGFSGEQCETDLDACAVNFNPCFPGVNCTDLPPPAGVDGFECGDCPPGYEGNGTICQDVDECETNRCQHVCTNLIGNFTCDCYAGYYIADNGFECYDIDECSLPNNCSQRCDNTDGSYKCSCWDGFGLEPDGQSCQPENPCETGDDPGCDPDTGWCTVNATGGALCVCEKGYKLAHDGVTCQDEDECETGKNHCNQLCNNTAGAYTCYCGEGYELTDDPVQPCRDIDECYEGTDNCSVNEICVNIHGSYYCACAPETTLRNGICVPEIPEMTTKPTTVEDNTVMMEVEMNMEEFTDAFQQKLVGTVAAGLTSFCARNMKEYRECTDDRSIRCGQTIATFHFTSSDVHTPQRFPYALQGDQVVIGLYVIKPGENSATNQLFPGEVLLTAMEQMKMDIEESFGYKHVMVMALASSFNPSVRTVRPMTTKSSPVAISKQETDITTIAISALTTTAILSVVALIYLRLRAQVKVVDLPDDNLGSKDAPVIEQFTMSESTRQLVEK